MNSLHSTPSDIFPCLTYNDAPLAIDWLCRVFGFTKRFVVPGVDGRVEHSELSFGSSVIMVSSPKPEMRRSNPQDLSALPQMLCVYVADPDRHYAGAKAEGAIIEVELRDEDYGARGYMARDPEGHLWYFGNYRPGSYWEQPADW